MEELSKTLVETLSNLKIQIRSHCAVRDRNDATFNTTEVLDDVSIEGIKLDFLHASHGGNLVGFYISFRVPLRTSVVDALLYERYETYLNLESPRSLGRKIRQPRGYSNVPRSNEFKATITMDGFRIL